MPTTPMIRFNPTNGRQGPFSDQEECLGRINRVHACMHHFEIINQERRRRIIHHIQIGRLSKLAGLQRLAMGRRSMAARHKSKIEPLTPKRPLCFVPFAAAYIALPHGSDQSINECLFLNSEFDVIHLTGPFQSRTPQRQSSHRLAGHQATQSNQPCAAAPRRARRSSRWCC